MWLGPVPELLRALLATTYHVPCVSQHRENYESTLSTRECDGEIPAPSSYTEDCAHSLDLLTGTCATSLGNKEGIDSLMACSHMSATRWGAH